MRQIHCCWFKKGVCCTKNIDCVWVAYHEYFVYGGVTERTSFNKYKWHKFGTSEYVIKKKTTTTLKRAKDITRLENPTNEEKWDYFFFVFHWMRRMLCLIVVCRNSSGQLTTTTTNCSCNCTKQEKKRKVMYWHQRISNTTIHTYVRSNKVNTHNHAE